MMRRYRLLPADEARGRAAPDELGARFVQLDVTDDASVAAAAAIVEADGGLDVLINNAGIIGTHAEPADITGSDALEVFDVNVFGIVRTIHAFVPLLRASAAPAIVNVTSGLGSFHAVHDESRIESQIVAPLYTSSKSAMHSGH